MLLGVELEVGDHAPLPVSWIRVSGQRCSSIRPAMTMHDAREQCSKPAEICPAGIPALATSLVVVCCTSAWTGRRRCMRCSGGQRGSQPAEGRSLYRTVRGGDRPTLTQSGCSRARFPHAIFGSEIFPKDWLADRTRRSRCPCVGCCVAHCRTDSTLGYF